MARPKTINAKIVSADVTINPASIAANTSLDVTAAVKGITPNYPVQVWATALESGLGITNAHCAVAGTVKFRLHNGTVGAIDAASQTFKVVQG